MAQVPHDRRAIIYLNALEEALLKVESKANKIKAIDFDDVKNFLGKIEEQVLEPKNINQNLAILGVQLSHAVIENRNDDATQIEQTFLKLSAEHTETSILTDVAQLIKSHSVSNYCYRNWVNTKEGIKFGMIEAELADNATIGIIGDWGTGDPDAKALLQDLKSHSPDIIIHLGDIYQSCRYEYDVLPNFINIFNEVYNDPSGKNRPPILTLAGNHDYMSKGGAGFYQLLDTVNAHHPKWRQNASYFCLRTKNKKWQFLGGDTGINDPSYKHRNAHPGLKPDEYTWHYDKMKNFSNKGQGRTIFMTHHPLFSAVVRLQDREFMNKDLAKNFNGYLTGGNIQAGEIRLWPWGHNHWFLPYVNTSKVEQATLDKGRLLGGSARHDTHSKWDIQKHGKKVLQFNGKPLIPDSNNGLPNHTYAVIRLSDTDAEVTHYQTPSWHPYDSKAVTTLPNAQHKVLLREYILDTKSAQKYPVH